MVFVGMSASMRMLAWPFHEPPSILNHLRPFLSTPLLSKKPSGLFLSKAPSGTLMERTVVPPLLPSGFFTLFSVKSKEPTGRVISFAFAARAIFPRMAALIVTGAVDSSVTRPLLRSGVSDAGSSARNFCVPSILISAKARDMSIQAVVVNC